MLADGGEDLVFAVGYGELRGVAGGRAVFAAPCAQIFRLASLARQLVDLFPIEAPATLEAALDADPILEHTLRQQGLELGD